MSAPRPWVGARLGFYVEIRAADGGIESVFGPYASMRLADGAQSSVMRSLDCERFHTAVVVYGDGRQTDPGR